MRLKNIIILSIVAVVTTCIILIFTSCDTRKDYFKDINKAPELTFKKIGSSSNVVALKDSMKLKQVSYSFAFNIIDEQSDLEVTPHILVGSGGFDINTQTRTIKYTPAGIQKAKILFSVSDVYTSTTDTLELTVFENLLPAAVLNIVKTQVNSPYECNISASSSYDRDAAYGGKIIKYDFQVGGTYGVVTSQNNINFIFPGPGNYNVKVRVQDDNNVWSDYVELVYQMN